MQKSLTPNLPDDQAISFYLQSHKLIFAVYQLANVQGVMKFDSSHAECSVPWLNEVLVLFTVALQLCQQLKDKVRFDDGHRTCAHAVDHRFGGTVGAGAGGFTSRALSSMIAVTR